MKINITNYITKQDELTKRFIYKCIYHNIYNLIANDNILSKDIIINLIKKEGDAYR